MGFLEKVKNMFTEEVEDDDVKVEQIKKEVTKVTIESPVEELKAKEEEPLEPERVPVFFDDNDFKDLKLTDEPKIEKVEEEKDIYGSRIKLNETKEEKKIFKPTPIISPVYGVLDKNYHKEDIVSRTDTNEKKEEKISSIDIIRNKAYGTLEDELENTLFGSNSILFKKEEPKKEEKVEVKEIDNDLLSDLTDDIGKELDELLVKKEKYSDEQKESKENNEDINDEDLLGFIDSTLYKDGDE